jgi:alpha-glucosidase
MKRKIALAAVLGIILVAVIIFAVLRGMDEFSMRQVSGRLFFDSGTLPAQDYTVGNFVAGWNKDKGGSLSIYSRSQPGKVLWQSIPGESFISAARGRETVTESRGSYNIKDSLVTVCSDQTIDSMLIDDGKLIISGNLSGGAEKTPYTAFLSQTGPSDLRFTVELPEKGYNRTFLTYSSNKDEHFFGFGEQFTYFDMKGRRLPIFCTEQGVGRGAQPVTAGADITAGSGGSWYTTYAGVPQYITSQMRSLYLENYEYSVFDLRQDERVQVQVWSPSMTAHILSGDSPAKLITSYTDFTGRMRPLPGWVTSGAIAGMQGGTEKVIRVYQQLQALGTPVAALWLQDWVGQRVTSFGKQLWWNWEVDESRYPGWDGLVSSLDSKGVRMMTYVSPFLVDVSEKPNSKRNLFKEAESKGYLVKNKAGGTYLIKTAAFNAGLLDLSNPDAYTWMKGIIKEQVIGAGAKGWMADFGEELPYDAVLYSGESASSYHNHYPEAWARLNRETIQEAGMGDEAVFFTRAAYTRSPGYSTLFWEGDQLVSWDGFDGIKTAVTGLLSSGMSGFSFNHSDIGGYTTITNPVMNYHRSKELLMRWMELNAFTTIYRTHEGNLPDANVQFYSDNETLSQFSRFARVYAAWAPYRNRLIQEAAQTGLPVVRHPFIHYPEDPEVYKINSQQFMVGTEFMVVPVLDEGQSRVQAYLPAGEWVHLWSGDTYGDPAKGIYVTAEAPIGQPAVFYRAGSAEGESLAANLRRAGILQPVSAR